VRSENFGTKDLNSSIMASVILAPFDLCARIFAGAGAETGGEVTDAMMENSSPSHRSSHSARHRIRSTPRGICPPQAPRQNAGLLSPMKDRIRQDRSRRLGDCSITGRSPPERSRADA